jgi:GntR family transcriptional regulator
MTSGYHVFVMTQHKKIMMLDHGPMPLYFQLKNILEAKILSQEFKENERLPSEAELCQQFDVSRVTVQRAVADLLKAGLIYRDRGKGTFVTEGARLKSPALKGSIQDLIIAAKGSRLKVLSYTEIPVPQSLSTTFRRGGSEKVFQLECVRLIPEGPQAYSLIYFPPDLGRMISPDELTETTEIISFVEEKLRHKAHRAHQTIDVEVADRLLAKHLSITPKTPLLVIQRDYYTRKGSLMYVGKSYFRSDRFRYEIELTRT